MDSSMANSLITIKAEDLINGTWNCIYSIECVAVSLITAGLVSKVAHNIFNVNQSTNFSYFIKACAFSLGVVVALLVSPNLSTFTGRKAIELIAISCILPPISFLIWGGFSGWVGKSIRPICAIAGGAMGVLIAGKM